MVIAAVTAAGAIVQGSVGIGLTLVAGPALVAIDADFAPGPVLMAGQVVGARHIVAERRHLDRGAFRNCLIGLPFGIAVGLVVVETVSDRAMAVIIGSLTAGAAVALLAGLHVRRSRRSEVGAGAVCAVSSVTAGLPGPPLAIAFSDMNPHTMRATTASFVVTVATIAFGGLVATGNFGRDELILTAWLLPGVLTGLVAARWVRPLVDRSWFRPAVLLIALAGGIALILRQLA